MTKSTIARRVALLSSSSLGLAAVVSAASLGAALAPSAAFAQTATCTPAATSGNGTAAATYAVGTYNPGILCNYTGDTATVTTSGAITVSTSGDVPGDPLVNGVNLRATGTNDVNWNSSAGTVRGGVATNGPLIDARTEAGNINIVTAGVLGGTSASSSTTTHGIFAQSSNGGNVSVTTRSGSVDTHNCCSSTTVSQAGIEARSVGGNVNVLVDGSSTFATVQGRLYGIRAEATGLGNLAITLQGNASVVTDNVNSGDPTSAMIFAKTGTGLLSINVAGELGNTGSRNASAVRLETGGDAVVNVGSVRVTGFFNPIFDMTTSAGTTTVLNIGSISRDLTVDRYLFRGEGGSDITINTDGEVAGFVDFSEHTGSLTWNINAQWGTRSLDISKDSRTARNRFGSGADTINVAADAFWLIGVETFADSAGVPDAAETTVIEFGAGEDRVVNLGALMVGPKAGDDDYQRYATQGQMETEARLTGLETFENAGSVYFGGGGFPGSNMTVETLKPGSYATAPDFLETDYTADDLLLMPGTHWIGQEGSVLVMDVLLADNQPACDAGLRNTATFVNSGGQTELTGEMPAADCMGLQGGSTEGVTNVLINQLGGGDRGGPIRIVLVDVEGGESAAGHFVLDPRNHGFVDSDEGGYLDAGYFIYPLVYDADAQQHILIGSAGPNAWQTATWATAAHDLWRTTTGSWFDRQADLRGGLQDGVGGGIWLRTSGDVVKRDVKQFQQSGTTIFTFDNSYDQQTYAVTGGVDLMVGGGADSAWVVGLMAGYANSKLEYDPSPNTAQLDSWNGGLYASLLSGGLYVDAALSANKADIEADIVDLNLFPAGTVLSTPFLSLGVQIEGGYRFPLSGGLFVEPLAGVSWVRTEWDELTVPSADPLRPGVDVDFGDPVSVRANIGARVGMDQDLGVVRTQYSLLGRVWNEAEGEPQLALGNVVEDVFVGDELTGTMTELGLGASIYGSVVSGFLNVGGKWADDYESVGGTVGVRVAW